MLDQPPQSLFPPGFQHSPSLIPSEGSVPPAMAPVPTPVMSPVVQMPAPPAGHPPVAAPIPAEPRDWSPPQWGQRPPIVGAIGVTSIVIASLSGLVGLVLTGYGFVFYVAAIAMSSRATWGGSAGAPTLASPGGGVAHSGTPRGQRQAVITSLTRTHPLDDPQRVAQLDAMLATAGRDLGTDNVLESGTMPDSRYGERGADYFVTPRGRLELFNDRAVFFPTDGSDTVRVSAPRRGAKGTSQAPETAPNDGDNGADDEDTANGGAVVNGDVDLDPSATGSGATGPAGATGIGGALTPAEAQAVVQQAQALAGLSSGPGAAPGAGLNPQQAATLQALLSSPGQQLVVPGASQSGVAACVVQPDGTAAVSFSNGSIVVLAPQGNVVSQITPTTLSGGFPFNPLAVALFIATAVLSVILSILLLVAGILMLGRSRSARRLHLVYASLKIPAALAGGFAIAFIVYELANNGSPGQSGAGSVARGATSFLVAIVPTLLACIYPVVLLAVLNTKSVRDYYRSLAA